MSMRVDVSALIRCGIHPTQAKLFAEPLAKACERFEINTPARIAAFIAQAAHESSGFTALEEDLHYRKPERLDAMFSAVRGLGDASKLIAAGPVAIADRVYAGRNGNGDEASGDGWRYRGRGLFQLTGRANYRAADQALGTSFEGFPELVALPECAALTAAWYWSTIDGNRLADVSLIDVITKAINGPAMAGADDRRSRFDGAMRALA